MGIKQPTGAYVHPGKRKRAPDVPKGPSVIPAAKGRIPVKKKREAVARPVARCRRKSRMVRLVVYPPAPGQIPLFDRMIAAGYSSRQALLGLLKKGFSQFENDLLNDKVTAPADQLNTEGKPVDTTRNVEAEFIQKAKDIFDPFDMLSNRALGHRIGETIIRSVSKDYANDRRKH